MTRTARHRSPTSDAVEPCTAAAAPDPSSGFGNAFLQDLMRSSAPAQDERTDLPADRLSFAARTFCDLDHRRWPQDLQQDLALRKDLPTARLGAGRVVVEPLPAYASLGPAMKQLVDAHEQVHVENARPHAAAFKQDIDDASGPWIFGVAGDEYLSANDYIAAFNGNGGGLAECVPDEQEAYTVMVGLARKLLEDPAHSAEHDLIRLNLPEWERNARSPSTCS